MNLLVTNHAQVLACIARQPDARLRDVAETVGLTERAVQRLIAELEREGFLRRIREGRRNRYEVSREPLQRLALSLQELAGGGAIGEAGAGAAEGADSSLLAGDVPIAGGDGIARHQSFID